MVCELDLKNNDFLKSSKRWLLGEAELRLWLNFLLSLYLLEREVFVSRHNIFAIFRNS